MRIGHEEDIVALPERSTIILGNLSLTQSIIALFVMSLCLAILPLAHAQTFTVLYTLNGTTDGNAPAAGLVADREGNLYGVASSGGGSNPCPDDRGCGTVFQLSRHGSGWVFRVLYSFNGESDGWNPEAPLAVASDGSIYGTTIWGGINGCFEGWGCGTVFRLQPPPTICASVSCPWIKTTLYKFTGEADGEYPVGQITFDQAGNVYGTASASESEQYDGSVFELSPSDGGWTFNLLYAFPGTTSGAPGGGLVFDRQGNLWGFQAYGGASNCGDPQLPDPCGSIYKLSPSSSGWIETTVFGFSASTGGGPSGTLVLDQSGNFYGTLSTNGTLGSGGIFQFVPSSGQFNPLYSIAGNPGDYSGPYGGVVMDPAGNLYAADETNGTYTCGGVGCGFVFELSPSNGSWYFTNLHDFTGHSDGNTPVGPLALDAAGNVYGVDLTNVIFEVAPLR